MSHLPMKWAERKNEVYITVQANAATDVNVQFTDNTIAITGKGVTPKSPEPHELKDEITLFKEIVPEKSSFKVIGVAIQILAVKKEEGYWNKLVNQSTSQTKNWLSVDWNLWKDEDDEDEGANADGNPYGGMDFGKMMGGMGGMGGMDLGGMMGGMGGMDMGDAPDSDDEEDEEPPAADLEDLDK